jgi:hypothetical protein
VAENSKLIKNVFAVQRFRNILFYELRFLDGFTLMGVFYFLGFAQSLFGGSVKILLIIISVAAILFTPYIFYVLIKEKKYGWIITFFMMTLIPLSLTYILFKDSIFIEALILIPLLSFYIYCYLIKFEVDKWLSDYSWHQERLQQKKVAEDRIKNEMLL